MNSSGNASIKPEPMSGWSGGVSERPICGTQRASADERQMERVGRRKFATRQDLAKLGPAPNFRVRPPPAVRQRSQVDIRTSATLRYRPLRYRLDPASPRPMRSSALPCTSPSVNDRFRVKPVPGLHSLRPSGLARSLRLFPRYSRNPESKSVFTSRARTLQVQVNTFVQRDDTSILRWYVCVRCCY